MAAKVELQERIAELEAAQAEAATLYEISRGLNAARDEDELLHVLARPAREAGVIQADLMYIDLDEAGEPEWTEIVAAWRRKSPPLMPVGTRLYLPEFPLIRLWLASPDEPLFVADATTDERMDENTRNVLTQMGLRALISIPLTQAGCWVGLINLGWDEPHESSEWEVKIYNALASLTAPAVHSRRLLAQTQEALREVAVFKTLAENSVDAVCITDLKSKVTYANRAFYQLFGYDYETGEAIGLPVATFVPEGGEAKFKHIISQALAEGWGGEIRPKRKDGSAYDAHITLFALRDEAGNPASLGVFIRDITAQKEAEAERERLQQQVIEAQKQAIRELSTPIIPIVDRIIVMPLVGSIDTTRAKDIMRALLAGIGEYRAKVVILDITGVPIVDTGVAGHLDKAIQAARLKGAHTIVTGISDAVAEAIVDLGIDWSGLETLTDLQTGLIAALNSLGIKLTR